MRDLSRLTKWLNNIPGWLKAGFGLVTGIVAFILAFRKDWQLYVTVTIALILLYLLGLSVYILLARLPSKSRTTKKRAYRFKEQRAWGLAGLGVCLLVMGFLLANPTVRQFGGEALFGTPTPLPTPTPPELEPAQVVISAFDSQYATKKQEVAHDLEKDLNQKLGKYGLSQVRVTTHVPETVASQIVKSAEDAQAVINAGSKVVIWGWYDDFKMQVYIFLSGGSQPGSSLAGIPEVPLAVEGDPTWQLSFVVDKVLPQNVSFLSLFVIGHLEYLSNHYEAGHEAFDAAMNNIPTNVHLENEALLHFFQARLWDSQGADVNEVICEYAKAIELDPGFAEAYNNLGVLSGRFIRIDYFNQIEIVSEPSAAAYLCLQKAGIEKDAFGPRYFYRRALEADPGLTLAEFNDLAFEWRTSPPAPGEDPNPYLAKFEELQNRDSSISGTYVILGVILESEDKPEEAIQMYARGTRVDPLNASLHFLLGQLLLSTNNDEAGAENELKAAVALTPGDLEARLALGNLYYGQGQFDKAAEQFDAIPEPEAPPSEYGIDDSPEVVSRILSSGISFNRADTAQAIEILRALTPEDGMFPFLDFLLGLLYQSNGQPSQAADAFGSRQVFGLYPVDSTIRLAWNNVQSRCQTWEFPGSLADWVARELPQTDCLPGEDRERIRAVYDIFHDVVLERRAVQQPIAHGAECPFVYTYDSQTNEWVFQTTILYRLVDTEATQTRRLTHFSGSLLIREEEAEVSHINSLYVAALLSDGSIQLLRPQTEALQANDTEYVVLHQGDEILVTMDGYPPEGSVQKWWVVATGYYVQVK